MHERHTSDRSVAALAMAMVALAGLSVGAAAVLAGPSAATPTDVSTTDIDGNLTLETVETTDETTTVTLTTDVEDVAGYQATLKFDSELTAVESVDGGDDEFDVEPVYNIENDDGVVRFNQLATTAPSDGVDAPTMAEITFETPSESTDVEFNESESLMTTPPGVDIDDLDRQGVTLDASDDDSDDGADDAPGDDDDGGDAPGDDDGGDAPGDDDDGSDDAAGGGGAPPGGDDSADDADGADDTGTDDADEADADPESTPIDGEVTAADDGANVAASVEEDDDAVTADLDGAVDDGSVSLDGLSLEPADGIDTVDIDVRSLDEDGLPDGTPPLTEDRGSSYVQFDTGDADGETVAGATIEFTVDAEELGLDPSDVAMYRFSDGDWTALDTESLGDGEYRAETPGFSVFAVGDGSAADDGAESTDDRGDDTAAGDDGADDTDDTGDDGTGAEQAAGDGDGEGVDALIGFLDAGSLGVVIALVALVSIALAAIRLRS